MIEVERYGPEHRDEWNRFVAQARNGVFLFHRDYMEYHADRFVDHSLLFRSAGKLVGVLPATERAEELASHGGLTFGGVVSGQRMTTSLMLDLFAALRGYLRERGVARLMYKAVPHIYHDVPAEEDLYALFLNGGRLVRRDVSSTLRMDQRVPLAKGRRSGLGAARKQGLVVGRSDDLHGFMVLEAEHLASKFGTRPVHSGDEMALLAERFPDNVKLFTARHEGDLVAGVIVFESRQVAHAQYIAANDRGRALFALDLVLDHLLNQEFSGKRYFDFGISTEQAGRYLNAGLIANKESYGGRATVYDFYELDAGT